MEFWKDIKEYEGLYQVSNIGNIKSLPKEGKRGHNLKILIPKDNGKGYLKISLGKNRKHNFIHRLVAQAFIENPENKPQVNHKDGNKLNNRLENLEWATCSENTYHKYRILKYDNPMKGKFGKNNQNSKKVNQYDLDGNFIKLWDCSRDIKRELNIIQGNISNCCLGKRKTTG